MVSPFDAMRKHLEKMYDSKCTIINYIEKVDEYGTTTHTPVTVAKERLVNYLIPTLTMLPKQRPLTMWNRQ